MITDSEVSTAIKELKDDGAKVIVATEAFGVDDPSNEEFIMEHATKQEIPSTASHEISGIYGLEIRTLTAAINASVLPKTVQVGNFVEEAIRETGVTAPLMIMKGDGGVTSMDTFRTKPILTVLSGPAASVAGALLYLKIANGIFVEVGGTSTNICIIKNGKPYLYIGSYEAPKTKFFSGVEKLIESKMPAHYLRNDKNKVLLYLIIDSSFKFYKEGLNVEDWETFSILPDREKVLIDKKIYNDAIDILTGNYIELSFGRKTLYQFTPKYFRQIDHIIKKIPHEQHNFNISFLDYNEHLQDLQNQLKELKQNTAEGAAASLGIQIEIGKTYRKLNNPVKAVNCFKNAIKLGIDDAGNFLHDSSNSLLKLHRIGIILDQICECYIEIGLLEFEVKNNKKGISYLWAGVKVFLDFYGQLLNITTYTGPINTDITDKNPASSWEAFDPFSFENKKDTLKFLEKLLDFIFYIKESKSDDKEKEFKNIEDFKQLKIKFLDELKNEILPNNLQKIKNQEDLKILLKHMFKNILSEENFDREIENAFYSTGYDPSTTFSDQGKLGNLHGYLIVVNQKLRNEKLAEFFSPKLLYCINTLSTVYSRLGQFELSAQLLRAGITISDNTSFHSNAIVQRLQLALFYLLRFDFIKSIKYYQATFRYLNVQRKYWQSNYYVNNEMLAGLFDIVGILQGVLVPLSFELDNFNKTENRQKTIRKKIHLIYFYTAQNYYLKENNNRKNTTSKIKLIKSLIYQGINEFHLIHNCKIELKLDKNNKVINFIKERAAEKDSTLSSSSVIAPIASNKAASSAAPLILAISSSISTNDLKILSSA